MAKIDAEYLEGTEQNLNIQAHRLEGARLLLGALRSRLDEPEPEVEAVQEEAEVVSGND